MTDKNTKLDVSKLASLKEIVPKKKVNRKVNTRKILDNAFESTVINTNTQEFKLDASSYTPKGMEEMIDYKLVYDEIESCIVGSEFIELNKSDEHGKFKKLNKADINRIYSHVVNLKPVLSKIVVFSVLSEYFDINSTKFYDSLSNTFKQELIDELKQLDPTVASRIGESLF